MMNKLLSAAFAGAALSLSAASPPGSARQPEHRAVNVTRSELSQMAAASGERFKAQVDEAIAALCPDPTLSSAQRSCELRARIAVQARMAKEPPQK